MSINDLDPPGKHPPASGLTVRAAARSTTTSARVAILAAGAAIALASCEPAKVVRPAIATETAPEVSCGEQYRGFCGPGKWCEAGRDWSRCAALPADRRNCGWEKWQGECTRDGAGGQDGGSGGVLGSLGGAGGGGTGGASLGGEVDAGNGNTGGTGGASAAPPATDATVDPGNPSGPATTADGGQSQPEPIADAGGDEVAPAVCPGSCKLGKTMCTDTGVATCVLLPSGCPGWSTPVACPMPQECPSGKTACKCADDASSCTKEKDTRCTATGLETCEKNGACLAWSKPAACPEPQTCTAGKSACECPKEGACTQKGAERCGASGVETCTKTGACLSWKTTKACTAPLACTVDAGGNADCTCGPGNISCPGKCMAPAGACVAIWFATPNGNGPPADCIHRSEGICRENECDLSIQKKHYIQPFDNLDGLVANCQSGGHYEQLFAAVCAELKARNPVRPAYVDFFADIYDATGAWKDNRWITNKACP
jgi:hypothetical protein